MKIKPFIIGILGSILISASSVYVAMRISALPWPTIFVAILSFSLLKILGETTLAEVNIAQTAMSSGSMVAGGIAFTIPGLFIAGIFDQTGKTSLDMLKEYGIPVLLVAISGVLLGSLFTWILRKKQIEEDKLPFPIGIAAADTIKVTATDKSKSVILYVSVMISAVITFIRDKITINGKPLLPATVNIKGQPYLWISLMCIGIGYIVGILYTGVWFIGAVIKNIILYIGTFKSFNAESVCLSMGIGLMVGVGIGVIVKMIYEIIKNKKEKKDYKIDKVNIPLAISSVIISYILSVLAGIGIIQSALLIIGVGITTIIASTLTGQSGINPMEILGIIVIVLIRIFIPLDGMSAFLAAAVVAVACGYAGDLMNDYKVGDIIKTSPKQLLIGQILGGIAGSIVSVVVLFALISTFGEVGGEYLTVAQAKTVAGLINGLEYTNLFYIFIFIGIVMYLVKLPIMTLGLGLLLPFYLSSTIFIGGLISFIIEKCFKKFKENGQIVATGLFGGESMVGVLIALVSMFMGR